MLNILTEISAVLPIFAYELKGQINIKDRLQKFAEYFDDVERKYNLSSEIKKQLSPMVTEEMLKSFDNNILKISKLINRKTYIQTKEKIDSINLTGTDKIDNNIHKYLNLIKNDKRNY